MNTQRAEIIQQQINGTEVSYRMHGIEIEILYPRDLSYTQEMILMSRIHALNFRSKQQAL